MNGLRRKSIQSFVMCTACPHLSEPQLSGHLDYPNTKSDYSIRVFVISVCSIRVNAYIATKLNELQLSEEVHLSEHFGSL